MSTSNSLKTIIITASDAQYFELVKGTIYSIRERVSRQSVSIGFLNLGCSLEQLNWLEQQVNIIKKPIWHFDFSEKNQLPEYMKGLLARPFLKDYFPGFDIYLWIDADAWVQDESAIDLLITGALRKQGLAIVPEVSINYSLGYGFLAVRIKGVYNWYQKIFDEQTASKFCTYNMLNAGIFALHVNAPHWKIWQQKTRERLQDKSSLIIQDKITLLLLDQITLNYIVYSINNLYQKTEMLPAWCNWVLHLGLPVWDEEKSLLVEPYLPHQPIGILHLSGQYSSGKLEYLNIMTTQGDVKYMNIRYQPKIASSLPANNPDKNVYWDYYSPNLRLIQPDFAFPNMKIGDREACHWAYLRRDIPHYWYVDKDIPTVGFLSRDEAIILYNNALQFKGKQALEIGCWMGWSACHLLLAGVILDIVDPILLNPKFRDSVVTSLQTACQASGIDWQFVLVPAYSPQAVENLALQHQRNWSFIFIDGNHNAPAPLNDAIACEKYAEADAMVLFHDLASPDVAQGLDYFRDRGWQTMIYQTMQIMGVAWRGNVQPVHHQPDPKVTWTLPNFLKGYQISNISGSEYLKINNNYLEPNNYSEFNEIFEKIRPFSLLSEARLYNLYTKAKEICIKDLPGHFVECGTYKGGVAAMLGLVSQRYSSKPRKVYAFDTFEGMPEPAEIDKHQGIPANQTGFGVGTLKAPIAENIGKICQLLNVQDIVIPVQGLFAQTLPTYKSIIGNISLLHADADWYESTMDIFRYLYDHVIQNGIIQVDDYGHWEGCRQAIHDFEKAQGITFNLYPIDYTGVWFTKQ